MFAICAFNDRMEWYGSTAGAALPTLHPATQTSLESAISWVNHISAGGLTDIYSPYVAASNLILPKLSTGNQHHPYAVAPVENTLPVIVLVTDGSVQNERDIVAFASKEENKRIRTFCFGAIVL